VLELTRRHFRGTSFLGSELKLNYHVHESLLRTLKKLRHALYTTLGLQWSKTKNLWTLCSQFWGKVV